MVVLKITRVILIYVCMFYVHESPSNHSAYYVYVHQV